MKSPDLQRNAVLRWRLKGDGAITTEQAARNSKCVLEGIIADHCAPLYSRIVEGWISESYFDKHPQQVFEITFRKPCRISTNIKF